MDNNLSDREILILMFRFGLGFEDTGLREKKHTYEEIGKRLGISRERARQLTIRAVKKIVHQDLPNWELVYRSPV